MTNNIILERIKKGNKYFSIFSAFSSFTLIIFIIYQKQLHLMTFYFIIFILLSEILNSIGNIIHSVHEDNVDYKKYIFPFTTFSDICTNLLFLFFSYSSLKLVKQADQTIKDKTKIFIIFSIAISIFYTTFFLMAGLLIDPNNKYIDNRFRDYYSKEDKYKNENNEYKFPSKFYYISLIHTMTIMLLSFFTIENFFSVIKFWEEKLIKDINNSESFLRLIKILYRYALITFLSWIFIIPKTIFVAECGKENNTLRDIIYLLSESMFCSRGLLISLNTIRSSKIQTIIHRFIEVDIKHYLLMNFSKYSSRKISLYKKAESSLNKGKDDDIDDNIDNNINNNIDNNIN